MWQLEKALANFPYNYFSISEEIQEQVTQKSKLISFDFLVLPK